MAVVSMDRPKSFGIIPYARLLAKLSAYGLNGNDCALLEDYLSARVRRVKVGDGARALNSKVNNNRANGHCYNFAWIQRS